jgi:hypothetical protein
MQKIMIISYYDLIEYFAAIKENLEKYEYIVCHYPLFRFAYDQHDKKKNYIDHFTDHISEEMPDIILWCFNDIPSDIFINLKKKFNNIMFIFYNFDEPMNISPEIFKKTKNCEIVMTTSKEYVEDYYKHGNIKKENIIYNIFGCDTNYYYPIDNIESNTFDCDIGMVCYNILYDTKFFNAQYINRKNMIENIVTYCKKHNKIFKIYGSTVLNEFFPENYAGDISYINKNKLYNSAKIMICTQSFCDKSSYFDENIFQIMASGGLLLTDKVKDAENYLTNKHDVIFLDKNYYIRQIDSILNNYDKYLDIRKNAYQTSKKYTWENWVKNMHIVIVKNKFNSKLYADLYNINDDEATFDHWLNNGITLNHIAMSFKIPNTFNYVEYGKKYNIEKRSCEYLYFHWYYNDKSDLFFGNEHNKNFDPTKHNITMEKYMELCTYFDKIKFNCDDNLINIDKISKHNPNCDINKLLEMYLQLTL